MYILYVVANELGSSTAPSFEFECFPSQKPVCLPTRLQFIRCRRYNASFGGFLKGIKKEAKNMHGLSQLQPTSSVIA